ncbi:MAG: hypothetical protein AAFV95_29595, partial [Bacteroidota bacterium]
YGNSFNGVNYFTDTLLIDSLTSVGGCDSTIRYQLTVSTDLITNVVDTICAGDGYTVGSSTYTATGTYTDVLTASGGCDSTVNLTLTVLDPIATSQDVTLCSGDEYNGVIYTSSTVLTETLVSSQGCDSIVTTNIFVNPIYAETELISLCANEAYQGVLYSRDTILVDSLS